MAHKISLCLLFIYSLAGAQPNLVPNPSFETYTSCPVNNGSIGHTGTWYSPSGGTPDYYNSCATSNTLYGVPQNFNGSQAPYNGAAYAGVVAFFIGGCYREYIQTQLLSPLSAGQTYYLSFYVSKAEVVDISTDDLGAYVSPGAINLSPGFSNFSVVPQVANPQGQILNDSISWTLISGTFVAAGGEDYITIGNFKDDSTTTKDTIFRPLPPLYISYYYVDEVCLSLNPLTCAAHVNVGMGKQRSYRPFFYHDVSAQRLIFEEQPPGCMVTIRDLFGRPVKTFCLDLAQQADVSEFAAGCYLVCLRNGQQESIQKVLIQ